MAGIQRQTLRIASGSTVSASAFTSSNFTAFGMQLPAAITSTAMTFQVSADDGTTYQDLYDATGATKITVAVAASRSYDLPKELTAWDHFKLVGGSSEGADRDIVVIGKRP